MQYTRLGNSGLVVSRLAFGAMTFRETNDSFPAVFKVDPEDAQRLVDRCLDAGINFFDTANAYSKGESERVLGQALRARRHEVVIATKVGGRMGPSLLDAGLSRRHLMSSVEGSLRRLGTDYIDVYIVHKVDPHTPIEETITTLDALVRQGKVRYVGYSNWPAWLAAKAVGIQERLGLTRFTAAQMYYSLLGRDLEHEIVPFVEDAGIGTMIWSPLAGGFLSGKYTRENLKAQGNRYSGFDLFPFDKERAFDFVDQVVRPIGQAHGATPAQVALAWLLTRRGVDSIILGASKLEQLEDNLGAASLVLGDEEISRLNDQSPFEPYYPNWFARFVADKPLQQALDGDVR